MYTCPCVYHVCTRTCACKVCGLDLQRAWFELLIACMHEWCLGHWGVQPGVIRIGVRLGLCRISAADTLLTVLPGKEVSLNS